MLGQLIEEKAAKRPVTAYPSRVDKLPFCSAQVGRGLTAGQTEPAGGPRTRFDHLSIGQEPTPLPREHEGNAHRCDSGDEEREINWCPRAEEAAMFHRSKSTTLRHSRRGASVPFLQTWFHLRQYRRHHQSFLGSLPRPEPAHEVLSQRCSSMPRRQR